MPTLIVNDLEMYYEIHGKGQPLMLLHGLGSSSRDWEMQVRHFSARYKVVLCDLRGHGRTSKPRGRYSIAQFSDDVAALLASLKLDPVHLVGISMGGMVAFDFAIRFPDMLKSLTIINSYPETRIENLKDRLMAWRRFFLLEALGLRQMGAVLANHLFPEQEDLRKKFVDRWGENDKRAYRESLRAVIDWDVEGRIHEITCPTLVVASDQDYFPLAEKQAYVSKMRDAKLVVIENARHAVTVQKPEQFNRILDEFLSGLSWSAD
ncbi:MAG: alpha/beta hydrolase [Anaerolineales bacterium]